MNDIQLQEVVLKKIDDLKELYFDEYNFLAPATERQVNRFENYFNVKIPPEFRWFILNVNNGIVSKNKWGFDFISKVDFDNYYHTKTEYNPSITFKFTKMVFWGEKENFKNYIEYPYEIVFDDNEELFDEYRNGDISLGGGGCGSDDFLVINGEEYGNIWADEIASNDILYPLFDKDKDRINFIDWLLNRIDNHIDLKTNKNKTNNNKKENRILDWILNCFKNPSLKNTKLTVDKK